MSRRSEIDTALNGITSETAAVISPLIDNVLFIEDKLENLKTLPFLAVNPNNPMQQKYTAAYKQYKELYQQYTIGVKILLSVIEDKTVTADSPLQQYFKRKMKGLEIG